ncbi:MAG: class I SAM-dependent methyltransferase [Chitinophagales bacterium]
MIPYTNKPKHFIRSASKSIASFLKEKEEQQFADDQTIDSFGEEWQRFHQFEAAELERIGEEYFDVVNEAMLNKDSRVLDIGCGSGRWSKYVSSRAGFVEAIDPSEAVLVAAELLKEAENVRVTQAGIDEIPFADGSFDFAFCLGVLHHLPNTAEALKKCVDKVKPNGYFLTYLYYSLDNRGATYRLIFKASNLLRQVVSRLPFALKAVVCDVLAVALYMPFVGLGRVLSKIPIVKRLVPMLPLSYYCDKSFYIIRNDALDRFGTPLEKRYSQAEIQMMMEAAGLEDIRFSEKAPFWHGVGRKKGI